MMEKLPSVSGEVRGDTLQFKFLLDKNREKSSFFEVSGAEDSGVFFLHGNGSVALLELVRVF